jgi:GAF domain-containing protein
VEGRKCLTLEAFGMTEALRRGRVDVMEDREKLSRCCDFGPACPLEEVRSCVRVPLVVQGQLIGSLNLGVANLGGLAEEDVEIVQEVADQLALAIQQARLHAAAVRRGEELAALLRASRSVMSGLDLTPILERIVEEAARISGCEHIKLLLVDTEAQLLRIGVLRGTTLADGFPMPVGVGLSGHVAKTGELVYVPDTSTDPRSALAAQDQRLNMRTYLGIPVKSRGEVLGVLTFNTEEAREYRPEELAYLTSFADQAAIAIENARLYREEQQRRVQLEAVRTVTAELTRELNLKKVLDLITRRALELVGAVSGTVWLWDEAEGVLVPKSWHGFGAERGDERRRLGEGVAGGTAQRREGLIVNDYRTSPLANPLTVARTPITAVLAEPLLYHDRLLGVVSVDRQDPGHPFTLQDRYLLALFADQASIAIENARLYEAIRQHAA